MSRKWTEIQREREEMEKIPNIVDNPTAEMKQHNAQRDFETNVSTKANWRPTNLNENKNKQGVNSQNRYHKRKEKNQLKSGVSLTDQDH